MSIVTKTGDAGTTAMMYGRRVSKCDPSVEAYGTVDELNAALGLARALAQDPWVQDQVLGFQKDLVTLMGELATHPKDLGRYAGDGFARVTSAMTAKVEAAVREAESAGRPGPGWAMPGATPAGAALDLARTICRRAERCVCGLQEVGQLGNGEVLVVLNRMSDLLWLLARRVDQQAGAR